MKWCLPKGVLMRNTLAIFLAAAVLPCPSAWADVVYKCKSPDGGMLYQETPCAKEAESVSSWPSKSEPKTEDSSAETLVIAQGRNGGYFVDGAVNNQFLVFAIDTGATLVTLPQAVATSAGIRCQKMAIMQTGNGTITACTSIIRELKFGPFTVRNVDVMIAPNLSQPLLGMNVLKRYRVEQDGGEMRLSKRY